MSQIREQTWSLLGDAFQQWKIFIIPGFVMYLALVTRLRHKRAKSLPKRFNYTSRDTYSKMTTDDAQAILKELTELEFPKFMGFSIIFALFKTYGIPSVSSLLVSTGQLANPETASRRTADTGVLLLEFALNKPSSERTIQAISRMNYLHSRYQKSGKITNADMLYTLSLFALEPSRWVDKYEWRSMTELELCASGTFWKAMGDAMLIPYDVLPSCKIGWEDGLDWLKEVEDWSLRYEAASMLPAPSNNQLAGSHVEVLFLNLPSGLMEAGKQIMAIFLGERLRKAMLFPKAPVIYQRLINGALLARKYFLRYLALPRPEFMRKRYIPSGPDPKTGRYNSVAYYPIPGMLSHHSRGGGDQERWSLDFWAVSYLEMMETSTRRKGIHLRTWAQNPYTAKAGLKWRRQRLD